MKILLLEQDDRLNQNIRDYFRKKQFGCEAYRDTEALLAKANFNAFDIAVFDISPAEIDGLDLLDYINNLHINLPVIFITTLDSIDILSKAFARGCEDYLRKPFDMKELELRIVKAVRNRVKSDEIDLGNGFTFIFAGKEIEKENINLRLTPTQRKIIYLLVKNRGKIVTFEQFRDFIWGERTVSLNALASHIRDMRKLLEGVRIKSIKGIGYSLLTDA